MTVGKEQNISSDDQRPSTNNDSIEALPKTRSARLLLRRLYINLIASTPHGKHLKGDKNVRQEIVDTKAPEDPSIIRRKKDNGANLTSPPPKNSFQTLNLYPHPFAGIND
jgi:hypothetical protein